MMNRLAYGAVSLPVRLYNYLYTRRLHDHCVAADGVEFYPQAKIYNSAGREAIKIGKHSLCMGEILISGPSGKVIIGDWCSLSPGTKIWSREKIEIGSRVILSHGVQIFDNNSHSMSAVDRHERFRELRTSGRHLQPEQISHKPVRIEDDAWIGFNSAILKGVTIGRGAIVGACSVITQDVPPFAVVVGNPPRKVGDSRE
jgi:acetyltransferase-like isoleucine patch superfamily enzyme